MTVKTALSLSLLQVSLPHSFYSQTPPMIYVIYFKGAKMFRPNCYINIKMSLILLDIQACKKILLDSIRKIMKCLPYSCYFFQVLHNIHNRCHQWNRNCLPLQSTEFTPVFSWVLLLNLSVLYMVVCPFILAIVLSILRLTYSDYPLVSSNSSSTSMNKSTL